MPYHIERDHESCSEEEPYAVLKDSDGEVMGCHPSREAAEDQLRALYAAEGEESSVRETALSLINWTKKSQSSPELFYTRWGIRLDPEGNPMRADATVIVVGQDEPEPAAEGEPRPFEADLVPEGVATDDGRYMALGSLSWREPPLTLLVLDENTEAGHLGAIACGHMDSLSKRGTSAASAMVSATGEMDSGELGLETARRVEEGTLGGVSVDLAIREWGARDPETGEIVVSEDLEEDEWMKLFMGGLQFAVLEGIIGAATIVPFPAFADARIAMLASGELRRVKDELLASSRVPGLVEIEGDLHLFVQAPFSLSPPAALLACAAGPLRPPAEWLADPKLSEPTPLTVTTDGRVFGHVATWECHNGYQDRCLRLYPSANGYAYFHTGQLETDDGSLARVGRITVKPHAPRGASMATVAAHYDDARRVAAFGRLYDDAFGVAFAGVTRSDAPLELLRDFLANPPSVDARRGEVLGISCVPVPGLPIVAPEARFVASAGGEAEVEALLLPPVTEEMLLAAAEGELGAIRSHSSAVVDRAWSASAERAKIPDDATPAQLRAMHAWVDSAGDPAAKSSYKFLHHHWEDGVGDANRRACSNGIGVLHGGRAGTSIPEGDRDAVEAHLQRHVDDFERRQGEEAQATAASEALRALGEHFEEGFEGAARELAASFR